MKRVFYITIIVCLLANCSDEYYSEGRVKTVSATEITAQTAVLNGKIEIVTAGNRAAVSVESRGFVFGLSSNDMDNTVTDKISGGGNFSCNVSGLIPNTKYYARTFAKISTAENFSFS